MIIAHCEVVIPPFCSFFHNCFVLFWPHELPPLPFKTEISRLIWFDFREQTDSIRSLHWKFMFFECRIHRFSNNYDNDSYSFRSRLIQLPLSEANCVPSLNWPCRLFTRVHQKFVCLVLIVPKKLRTSSVSVFSLYFCHFSLLTAIQSSPPSGTNLYHESPLFNTKYYSIQTFIWFITD